MNPRSKLSAAILAVLSVATAASLSAYRQEVTLAYRWTKGEPLLYSVTQVVNTTMSGMPGMGEVTFDQTTSQVLRTVADSIAEDGTTTLSQTIDSVRMEMNTPMGKMGFDSANPDALQDPTGMMKGVFTSMLGEPFTVVLAPTGRVDKVDGMSRVMEKMFKSMPQTPGGAQILDGLKNSLSDEAMRGMLSQGFAQFPGKPVRVGETWTAELKMSNPAMGMLVTSTSLTLTAVEGTGDAQLAKVAMKLSIKQEQGSSASNPLGMTIKLADAAGTGDLSFNVAKGRLVRSSVQIDMPFTMSGTAPDGTAMNMTSMAKSTTTVEAIEK
jgi:hypothetical protein